MTQVQAAPATVWLANDSIMETIKDLISKYHPDLALCSDEIAVVFKEKASKSGGPGKTSKASKLHGLLGEKDWKFVITIGFDAWDDLSDPQKVALLDHHLCACGAEENEKTETMRYYIRTPELVFFQDEVARHGWWRTTGKKVEPELLKDLFGESGE